MKRPVACTMCRRVNVTNIKPKAWAPFRSVCNACHQDPRRPRELSKGSLVFTSIGKVGHRAVGTWGDLSDSEKDAYKQQSIDYIRERVFTIDGEEREVKSSVRTEFVRLYQELRTIEEETFIGQPPSQSEKRKVKVEVEGVGTELSEGALAMADILKNKARYLRDLFQKYFPSSDFKSAYPLLDELSKSVRECEQDVHSGDEAVFVYWNFEETCYMVNSEGEVFVARFVPDDTEPIKIGNRVPNTIEGVLERC